MAIFNSYVSLPDGKINLLVIHGYATAARG